MECLCVYCSVLFVSYNFFIINAARKACVLSYTLYKIEQHSFIDTNFTIIIKVRMQVLLRREGRRGGLMLKNRCRFFFDGKKTRFSKMQMALGGEQAGTCVFFISFFPLRFRT